MVLSVRQRMRHLRSGLCCCNQCNNEKEFVECGPGLVPKLVIDRLGRKSTRCVRSDREGESEKRHPELVPGGFLDAILAKDAQSVSSINQLLGSSESTTKKAQNKVSQIREDIRGSMGIDTTRLDSVFNEFGGDEMADFSWAVSSVTPRAQMIHAAIEEIKGGSRSRITDELGQSSLGADDVGGFIDTESEELDPLISDLRASMGAEQSFLTELLGEGATIRMYRGLDLPNKPPKGKTILNEFPASSWTITPATAQVFALKGNEQGTVVARDVPITDIISSMLSNLGSSETEFVLYTPGDGVEVEVLE